MKSLPFSASISFFSLLAAITMSAAYYLYAVRSTLAPLESPTQELSNPVQVGIGEQVFSPSSTEAKPAPIEVQTETDKWFQLVPELSMPPLRVPDDYAKWPISAGSIKTIDVQEGTSLRSILMDRGADLGRAVEIQSILSDGIDVDFRAGQKLRVDTATDPETGFDIPVRVRLYERNDAHLATIVLASNGHYVPAGQHGLVIAAPHEPSDSQRGYLVLLSIMYTTIEAMSAFEAMKEYFPLLRNYRPDIETTHFAGGPAFRLRIGPFANLRLALKLCQSIADEGKRQGPLSRIDKCLIFERGR